jgi:hypothetical protein
MAANSEASWLVADISEVVATNDPARIAHRLGGIVANDERIREAIAATLATGEDEGAILVAVAKALTS